MGVQDFSRTLNPISITKHFVKQENVVFKLTIRIPKHTVYNLE